MDLELKHLGQTLAVGGLAIYAFLMMVRIYKCEHIFERLVPTSQDLKLLQSAVLLSITFATGILLEDIAQNIANERYGVFRGGWISLLFENSKDIRTKNLVHFEAPTAADKLEMKESSRDSDSIVSPSASVVVFIQPHDLLDRLKTTSIFLKLEGDAKSILNECLDQGRRGYSEAEWDVFKAEKFERLREAANTLYFKAKNRVYLEDTYFSELSAISHRIDFTRALAVGSVCVIIVAFCSATAFSIVYLIFRMSEPQLGRVWRDTCTLIAISALLYTTARAAYATEVISYNQRVFGYFRVLDDMDTAASPPQ